LARRGARIADISEMIDLAPSAISACLISTKLPMCAPWRGLRRPQPRERADGRVIADAGASRCGRP
jgi:hypothetical protein